MRQWLRDRMRRRTKRGPNTSESTGKIGQELPQNQPAPLQPSYQGKGQAPPAEEEPDFEGLPESPPESLAVAHEAPAHQVPAHKSATPKARAAEVPAEPIGTLAAAAKTDEEPAPAGKLVLETQPESLATPPPEAVQGTAKGARGFVVLTIGLPGSGKTTWFKRRGVTPLSSDLLRSLLFDDITEQRWQGLVFSTLRSLLRARLIAKMPWNYVDATNLSPHERRQWIKMAKSFGYDVQAVFFDVPLEVCMERNRRRERTVSDDVMKKMAERLRPPDFKEGFSKITVVRVKGAPGAGAAAAGEDE
jgi:predicted kinase